MYLKEYTLDKESFMAIHNILCKLQWHKDDAVKAAVEDMRKSLKGLYAADDAAFKAKMEYYDSVKKNLALFTFWSMFEVDDMHTPHPYRGAQTLVYKDHWGEEPVYVPLEGTSWASLWVAADSAIVRSGDNHHAFIEGFRQVGSELFLTTGS